MDSDEAAKRVEAGSLGLRAAAAAAVSLPRISEDDLAVELYEALRMFDREGRGRVRAVDLAIGLRNFGDPLSRRELAALLGDLPMGDDGTVSPDGVVQMLSAWARDDEQADAAECAPFLPATADEMPER